MHNTSLDPSPGILRPVAAGAQRVLEQVLLQPIGFSRRFQARSAFPISKVRLRNEVQNNKITFDILKDQK